MMTLPSQRWRQALGLPLEVCAFDASQRQATEDHALATFPGPLCPDVQHRCRLPECLWICVSQPLPGAGLQVFKELGSTT